MAIAGLSWEVPSHPTAPLPSFMGSQVIQPQAWFNNALCGSVNTRGTQEGPTCGLFAVNHVAAGAAALQGKMWQVLHVDTFEQEALRASLGDSRENLMDEHGANYDISVLTTNLQLCGLRAWPMSPYDLQGDTAATSRLQQPYSRDCLGMFSLLCKRRPGMICAINWVAAKAPNVKLPSFCTGFRPESHGTSCGKSTCLNSDCLSKQPWVLFAHGRRYPIQCSGVYSTNSST